MEAKKVRNATTKTKRATYYYIEIEKGEFISTNRPAKDQKDVKKVKETYENTERDIRKRTADYTKPVKMTKEERKVQEQRDEKTGKVERTEITFRPFKINENWLKKRKAKFEEIPTAKSDKRK